MPIATRGDAKKERTFQHVGELVSAWETIEFALCRIHSAFLGDPSGEAMRLYGSYRSLPSRMDNFSRAAEHYFRQRSHQNREIWLHQLLVAVKGFSGRRNEIAHGILMRLDNIEFFREKLQKPNRPQYGIIPPYHFQAGHADDGFPLYAYSSAEISTLLERMAPLYQQLDRFYRIVASPTAPLG